jgi:hypothetical protein
MAYTDPSTAVLGELAHAADWNTSVRDNFRAMGPHLIVRKPSDESLTSNTTLQADDHLILPVAANEVWRTDWDLLYQTNTTADLKIRWTFPAGGTLSISWIWVDAAAAFSLNTQTVSTSPTSTFSIGGLAGGAGSAQVMCVPMVYVNGSTGGSVVLEWAQNTSDANASIMKANSALWGVKLA